MGKTDYTKQVLVNLNSESKVIKNLTLTSNTPVWLAEGELAVNIVDKKLWVGNTLNTPVLILSPIMVAAAGTLTGTTLAANVLASSLTSVGILSALTVTATIVGSITGNSATATNVAYSGLTGTVPTWNQSTTGNALTSTTAGTVTTAAQPAITSVGTLTGLTVTNPISGSITGNAATATTATSATNAGTVTTAAQPAITSVGTLTSLTTSSNITFSEPNGTSLFGLGNGFDLTNVALGNALQNCTPDANTGEGQYNLGIGAGSLNAITIGAFNTAVGANSLAYGATCSQNVAIGDTAMGGNLATPQTGTGYNIAIGNLSCNNLTTNTNVIGIGRDSFASLGSGNSNIAIGLNAGKFAISTTPLTNTANSIYIGATSKASAATGNTNEIVIGSTALGLGSNTVVLGNTNITNTYLRGDINLVAGKKIIDATVSSLTSQNASGTGVSPTIQVICPSSATALTSGATAQNVFSPVGFDTISVQAATTYMFDGFYLIKTTGTTTHTISMSFALTTATITNCTWTTMSYPLASTPTSAIRTQDGNFFAAVAGGLVNSTNATAFNVVKFEGIMRVNAAGSVVPQITFSAAPGGTNTLEIGSYLRFYPIGSNTIDSVGTAIG